MLHAVVALLPDTLRVRLHLADTLLEDVARHFLQRAIPLNDGP
jgi:hypothetical protein